MDNDTIDEAFRALHSAQRSALLLYMDLRDAGNDVDAASAKLRADRLQNEIDNLINKELDAWQKDAGSLIPQLSQAADAAQKAVDQVESDVSNAQNIVSAMQTLDTTIDVAMKLIS